MQKINAKYVHLNAIVQKYVIFIHFHTSIQKYANKKLILGLYIHLIFVHNFNQNI